MIKLLLLCLLINYLIINFLFIVKAPKYSWLCIIIWYAIGAIFVDMTGSSGWLLIEDLKPSLLYSTIKWLFTYTIIFGNIAVSLVAFFKK